MSMHRRGAGLRQRWRSIKAPRRKFQDGDDLLPPQVKPVLDFIEAGACLEIFKYKGNRHARVLEHPRPAHLAWNAFYSRTLGPIESRHELPSCLRRLI